MRERLEFHDKNKNGQRVKIRGSQFIKREEKQTPKQTIRKPFIVKKDTRVIKKDNI